MVNTRHKGCSIKIMLFPLWEHKMFYRTADSTVKFLRTFIKPTVCFAKGTTKLWQKKTFAKGPDYPFSNQPFYIRIKMQCCNDKLLIEISRLLCIYVFLIHIDYVTLEISSKLIEGQALSASSKPAPLTQVSLKTNTDVHTNWWKDLIWGGGNFRPPPTPPQFQILI